MIRVKVTKNISKPKTVFGKFTLGQIIVFVIGLAAALVTFFLLYDKMDFNLLMCLTFAEVFVIIIAGVSAVTKGNGVSPLWAFIKSFKGTDKRPYSNNKGVFDKNDKFNIF